MSTAKVNEAMTAHVTGLIIEHGASQNKTTMSAIKAEYVEGKVRLIIKQGNADFKCWASDWKFINERIEETLAKKRLIKAK